VGVLLLLAWQQWDEGEERERHWRVLRWASSAALRFNDELGDVLVLLDGRHRGPSAEDRLLVFLIGAWSSRRW
jgi:hypothetical protein